MQYWWSHPQYCWSHPPVLWSPWWLGPTVLCKKEHVKRRGIRKMKVKVEFTENTWDWNRVEFSTEEKREGKWGLMVQFYNFTCIAFRLFIGKCKHNIIVQPFSNGCIFYQLIDGIAMAPVLEYSHKSGLRSSGGSWRVSHSPTLLPNNEWEASVTVIVDFVTVDPESCCVDM